MTVNRILEDNSDQQHVLVEYDVNDIGTFSADFMPQNILDEYVKKSSFPSNIECDDSGKDFPFSIIYITHPNEEKRRRDYILQKVEISFLLRMQTIFK